MYARTHTQRKKATEYNAVPQLVQETLRSGGQPLDDATRAFMEPRFGHDFGQVRVHTGAQAAQSAEAVSALAYTVGRDVVFGAGKYQPHSDAGRRLLAHELTHVVQQSSGPVSGVPMAHGLAVSEPGDQFEREADSTADRVMSIGNVVAPSFSDASTFTSTVMTMQRCGATPCNCSAEKRLAHEQEEMQIQRFELRDASIALNIQRERICDESGSCYEQLEPIEITGDPNSPIEPELVGANRNTNEPIVLDPVEITGDPNAVPNALCKKKINKDVKGCQAKANTACSIYGAAIAGVGLTAGSLLGPLGALVGGVGGTVFGAYQYGTCLEEMNAACEDGVEQEVEKCDQQFPTASS